MFGIDLDTWNAIMVSFLGVAAVAAVIVGVSTAIIIKLQKQADLESRGIIARLNNDTVRLQADNLALQTVLLPRHLGLIGFNGPPPAAEWFAGLEAFAGTEALIQSVPEAEAQNLAREISIILQMKGWHPQFIDEARSHMASLRITDGVEVSNPTGKPWTAEEPNQPWFAWNRAADALANALAKAGLGIGDRPIGRGRFSGEKPPIEGIFPYFDPPLTGVLVLVGGRPVAATVQWIKQGRPDRLGNKAADAVPAEPPK